MKRSHPLLAIACLLIVSPLVCLRLLAQTSTILNLTINADSNAVTMTGQNAFLWSQTGTVSPLGSATLVSSGSVWAFDNQGQPQGPVQLSFVLYFNQVDTLALSFTHSDPNFYQGAGFNLADGTITGGTGAYAGATGSLSLAVTYIGTTNASISPNATTTGSGTLTVGGKTTALTITNFSGGGGGVFFPTGTTYYAFANPNGYTLTTGTSR